MRYALPLLLLIVVSGCVYQTQTVGGGLNIRLQPDPAAVFSNGFTTLHIDLDNQNPRRIKDVMFDVFDTGILRTADQDCTKTVDEILPYEFKSFACLLNLDQDIISKEDSTTVNTRVTYQTDLPTVQLVEMMNEAEYQIRVANNDFTQKPSLYDYKDNNMELDVEFSEPLPIILRPEKEYFVNFKIKNIGNGFVQNLQAGDFIIRPVRDGSPQILDCPSLPSNENPNTRWSLDVIGKEFPSITCKILMPDGVSVVENYGLLLILSYRYEVRQSAIVGLVR